MKEAKPNDVSPLNQDHKITQSIENKKEKCVIFVPNKPNDQGPQKHCHVLPIICLFICLSSSVILLLNYLPQQKDATLSEFGCSKNNKNCLDTVTDKIEARKDIEKETKEKSEGGYSLITNIESCIRKLFNDGYPTACIKYFVPSRSSCEAYCTTQTSCGGFIYYSGSPVSHTLCVLTQSDKNCPSTFHQEESRYTESNINWFLYSSYSYSSTADFSCYGKNLETTVIGKEERENAKEEFKDLHVVVIGGYNTQPCNACGGDQTWTTLNENEVVRITENGTVLSSNCHVPFFKAFDAAGAGLLICAGGKIKDEHQCYELNYNSSTLKWVERNGMKFRRIDRHVMTSTPNGEIFACGGRLQTACERYDGNWTIIRDLPTRIGANRCMVGTEDAVYVIGQDRVRESVAKNENVYKYDIENDEWIGSNYPGWDPWRRGYSCLSLGDEIIIVGGYGMNTSDIFNVRKHGLFRRGPDLPKNVWKSQLVKAQPSSKYAAYLIGGQDGGITSLSDIYGLTKDLEKFDKIGNLKTPRSGHIALVLPDKAVEKCAG